MTVERTQMKMSGAAMRCPRCDGEITPITTLLGAAAMAIIAATLTSILADQLLDGGLTNLGAIIVTTSGMAILVGLVGGLGVSHTCPPKPTSVATSPAWATPTADQMPPTPVAKPIEPIDLRWFSSSLTTPEHQCSACGWIGPIAGADLSCPRCSIPTDGGPRRVVLHSSTEVPDDI